MASKNAEILSRIFDEVWNQGRYETIDEFYSKNFVAHYPPISLPWGEGREGVKALLSNLRTAFPDFHEEMHERIEAGDRIIARSRLSGTNTGPLPIADKPTGKHFETEEITIFRFEHGELAEQWGAPDVLGMLVQLGLVIPPVPREAA
jgi:predicted ester cyclase